MYTFSVQAFRTGFISIILFILYDYYIITIHTTHPSLAQLVEHRPYKDKGGDVQMYARIAQLVERRAYTSMVLGSSPSARTHLHTLRVQFFI